MTDHKPSDTETILMALDQISQTIDVMTSVVNRLRTYVQKQESSAENTTESAMHHLPSERIVH